MVINLHQGCIIANIVGDVNREIGIIATLERLSGILVRSSLTAGVLPNPVLHFYKIGADLPFSVIKRLRYARDGYPKV